MIGTTRRSVRPQVVPQLVAVEVATTSADPAGATIRITGAVARAAVPLLATVLNTHLRAGRRYLRVDLGSAELGLAAVRCLAAAADAASAAGGALIVADAQPGVTAAIESIRRTPVRA